MPPLWETSSSEEEDVERQERVVFTRRRRTFNVRTNYHFVSTFEFNERFRTTSITIEYILGEIGHILQHPTDNNHALSPRQQLCLALHWLGTGSQYHAVGDMHGVKMATVCRTVHRVVRAVNEQLFDEAVRWPTNINNVIMEFHSIRGMPNVVGCVDGTIINIEKPHEYEANFVDRHGNHSLNCMAVTGPNYMFYYVNASWPGSVHDSRVLRNTNLYRRMQEGWRPAPNAIILGDSGYPLLEWLITPTERNLEDPAVRAFNVSHKATRRTVENAFGILKEKFPCLNYMRMQPLMASEIFKCCTALCNIVRRGTSDEMVLQEEDEERRGEIENPVDHEQPPNAAGLRRLNELINHFR